MLEEIIAKMNGIIAILIHSNLNDIRLDGFMNMELHNCKKTKKQQHSTMMKNKMIQHA